MRNIHQPIYSVIPPHILRRVAEHTAADGRKKIASTLQQTSVIAERRSQTAAAASHEAAPGKKRRSVFDAWHARQLPGHLVMDEHKHSDDAEAVEAFDGSGATYDFYWQIFQRNSIDDRGMKLNSTIHYGQGFDNALWDGSRMIYGDGDGEFFSRFTAAVEVIGHELTHGVTQFSAGVHYAGQSGALNEHISDAFGIMIKQHLLGQTATGSDWLIGVGLFTDKVKGKALRSMAEPGTAYDDPVLGRDLQPAHMRDYVKSSEDNGGVHINSGIPNHAFYLAATGIGGKTWDVVGRIWYAVLTTKLGSDATFTDMARATVAMAREMYGAQGQVQSIVAEAWETVGVRTSVRKSSRERAKGKRPAKWRNRPAV